MGIKYKDKDAGIEIAMTVIGPDGEERELTGDMQRTVIDRIKERAKKSEHVFAKIEAEHGEKAAEAAKAVVSMLHYHYTVFRLMQQCNIPEAIVKQMLSSETKAESMIYRAALEGAIPNKMAALLVMKDCAALAREDFQVANGAADEVESMLQAADDGKEAFSATKH